MHCLASTVVRTLFAIDACYREIMVWLATTAGVSAEMVCDLMIACIERGFGAATIPHPVEWLADSGSAYITKQTSETATALGLPLLYRRCGPPQSNSISEAFVKTLRRDYVRHAILPDEGSVVRLLRVGSRQQHRPPRISACACSHLESSAAGVPKPDPAPVRLGVVHSSASVD